MTLGLVLARDGVIYAAVDSSQTCFADPGCFMETKLLWINKNMLMICAGDLKPLKILRDLAGSYSNRLSTLDSAADFIVDWLDKLSAKEDAASDCILCTYDAESKAQAFFIQRCLGGKASKVAIDISKTSLIASRLDDKDSKAIEGKVEKAMAAGLSPYQAMSEAIYQEIGQSPDLAPPVVHEIVRAGTIQRFS